MAFKLRSGNGTTFKNMGTSPFKDMKTGSYKQSFESPAKQKNEKASKEMQNKMAEVKAANLAETNKILKSQGKPPVEQIKESPAKHVDSVDEGSNRNKRHADKHNKRHSEGGTHGEIGSKDNKWDTPAPDSPAKQRSTKGGEGKDQNKILDNKGNHVGNWVNDKKVMFNDKPAVDPKAKPNKGKNKALNKIVSEMLEKGFTPTKLAKYKSPAKQTATTFADGSKKSARDKFNDKETAAEQRKNGGRDNQKRKSIVGEKTSGFGPVAQKNNLTPKQNAVSRAEMKGIDSKSAYWYKIDGKTVSKKQYLNYENKPGNMEGGGKQTNHPDVYGRKASNHGRGPKTK